jgi:nickel-dependent lactate racemase
MLLLVTGTETSSVTQVAQRLAARFRLPHEHATSIVATAERARALTDGGGGVVSAPELSAADRVVLSEVASLRVVDLDREAPGDAVDVSARLFRKLLRDGFRSGGKLHFAEGGADRIIDARRAEELVDGLLADLGPLRRVLLVPPDFTRFHSGAGELTALLYRKLSATTEVEVLPALGTHAPMSSAEIARMFPGIPESRFRVHEWRSGLREVGEVPSRFVSEVSGGKLDYAIRCELDSKLTDGGWDRIISVGQLVPHEVIGIAGHDKNVFVGTGGKDVIDRTHFLGAVCGMESIMGRPHSPVRDVLQYMAGELCRTLPITHLLTVRERARDGSLVTRGLFAGDDATCFLAGAPLVRECNLELFEKPLKKVVVYLDPEEFKSTWLGNKAVYRTRMVLADGGELLVLAPGVARFGEDAEIDRLIRRYGYYGTPNTLDATAREPELAASLSAAAHLIHGSSEGRFRIAYAPGELTREEVTSVGYDYENLGPCLERYNPERLSPGLNTLPDGEEIFFVPNPALGLWGVRSAFED